MKQYDRNKSLLFVCFGNTCRSPMAAGLAKKILGNKVKIESAGLAPFFESATREAVEVLKNLYGINISNHSPRSVFDLDLDRFDLIIALDSIVWSNLHTSYPYLSDKILLWEIEDPFGKDMKVYEKSAEKIQDHIKKHSKSTRTKKKL